MRTVWNSDKTVQIQQESDTEQRLLTFNLDWVTAISNASNGMVFVIIVFASNRGR